MTAPRVENSGPQAGTRDRAPDRAPESSPECPVARRRVWLGALRHLALADGYLSPLEVELLRHWSQLLAVGQELVAPLASDCGEEPQPNHRLLDPLRRWLEAIEPRDAAVARMLVRLIPAQCPFERDLLLFGRKLAHIQPMCKINPVYDQLMALRFRCLCVLEDEVLPRREGA